jgi:hypothetical protein
LSVLAEVAAAAAAPAEGEDGEPHPPPAIASSARADALRRPSVVVFKTDGISDPSLLAAHAFGEGVSVLSPEEREREKAKEMKKLTKKVNYTNKAVEFLQQQLQELGALHRQTKTLFAPFLLVPPPPPRARAALTAARSRGVRLCRDSPALAAI